MAGYLGTKAVLLSTTAANVVGNATIGGDLTVDTDTLYVDSTNNQVGIGTDSPTNQLHVASTADSSIRISAGGSGDNDAKLVLDGNGSGVCTIDADKHLTFTYSGTERMRIDSSGNVGIGTSSPSNALEVSGEGVLRIRPSTDNSQGELYFNDTTTSGNSYRSDIGIVNDGGLFFKTTGTINTAPTEAMRIDSDGNLLVGTTDPIAYSTSTTSGAGLKSTGVVFGSVESANAATFNRRTTNGTIINLRKDGSTVGTISITGSATSYNTSSDYRLKENITPIQGASDIVKQMRPATYTFKSDGSWHDGFLAHELQELHPRAVIGSKDAMKDEEYEVTPAVLDEDGAVVTEAVMGTRSVPDYQGVDYSKLTPILTAALQEALTEIASLKTRVEALEAV